MKYILSCGLFIALILSCEHLAPYLKHQSPNDALADISKDWVRLTPTDSGWVIYNACDGGNLLLTVRDEKSNTDLLLHGQQKNYAFEIDKILKTVSDTMYIKAKWKNSNRLQDFKFTWIDESKKQARWSTTFAEGNSYDFVFVAAENQHLFPIINQPCIDCWGKICEK